MKNNVELRESLNKVFSLLATDPRAEEAWEEIRARLGEAFTYAAKCHDLRVRLRESQARKAEQKGER